MPKHVEQIPSHGMPHQIVSACAALSYILQDDVWPKFWEWVKEQKAVLPDVSENNTRELIQEDTLTLVSIGVEIQRRKATSN